MLLLLGSAQAATHTVTLTSGGPSPTTVTVSRGDTVTFSNTDSGTHTITHNAGAWSYTATIPAGGKSTTPAFTASGSFGYDDTFGLALFPQHVNGFVKVVGVSPSPTRSPTASPRPTATHSASPVASATPSSTTSGIAITPGLGVGSLPPPPTSPPPNPSIAPPTLAPSASSTPLAIGYGDARALVQPSPHRYGLPALLALIGAVGVLSLLVRLLLSLKPAG